MTSLARRHSKEGGWAGKDFLTHMSKDRGHAGLGAGGPELLWIQGRQSCGSDSAVCTSQQRGPAQAQSEGKLGPPGIQSLGDETGGFGVLCDVYFL